MNYPIELVFGAACAAHRVNGEYVKSTRWPDVSTKTSNRQLMLQFLSDDCDPIDESDIEKGREVRKYFQTLMFKVLQGTVLNEFDSNALTISNIEHVVSNYQLSVICSFPASYLRGKMRDTAENRIKFATGGFIGQLGDKVTLTVAVLRSFYSQQWGVYYVTAITPDDQALFFSVKQPPLNNDTITINGTVKSHRDNQTQLNRVKIISTA